jgi:hypothetical protein
MGFVGNLDGGDRTGILFTDQQTPRLYFLCAGQHWCECDDFPSIPMAERTVPLEGTFPGGLGQESISSLFSPLSLYRYHFSARHPCLISVCTYLVGIAGNGNPDRGNLGSGILVGSKEYRDFALVKRNPHGW